jgi:glyoxylase-like metal-dependent hydrolase (beta-lactamase superfamily II)
MYAIQPLKVAECRTEQGPKMFYLQDFDRVYTTTFYFWYIEGAGTRILMDVGFDLPEGRPIMPTLVQEPGWRPAERLRQIGVDPRSIEHIIVTHLHFDHLSSTVDLFPNARLYLHRKEYDTAVRPPHPWLVGAYLPGIIQRLDGDLRGRLELIERETEILPGLSLFWNGGHTPGLQSVLLPTRLSPRTCLASDLCIFYRHIEEDQPIGVFTSLVEVLEGMARCRSKADVVLPNHDPLLEERFPVETFRARAQ